MSAAQGVQLSPRDMEILAKAWQCFEDTPKVNWAKLAEVANFKNAATARACFAPIKKKLVAAAAAAASGTPAPAESGEPTTPAKGRRKRKAETEKTPDTGKRNKVEIDGLELSSTDDDRNSKNFKHTRVATKTPTSGKRSRKAAMPANGNDEDSDAANAKAKADIKLQDEETQDGMLEDSMDEDEA
ncbi:hypothetical protein F5Y05DRAFT_199191 [Hypoxylon sp. FL0543]|nr:hypothetical protein F5Y05DRAFT_199191 [Hypoxylon sp. FL0543]